MSEQVTPENDPLEGATAVPGSEADAARVEVADASVDMHKPEFAPLTDTGARPAEASINRFFDVQVTVSAELGRVTMPIGDLVELGEGSVVELNRSVSSPIDLMAQGVRVATGEVVVIDDCFAVRIKSIDSTQAKKG